MVLCLSSSHGWIASVNICRSFCRCRCDCRAWRCCCCSYRCCCCSCRCCCCCSCRCCCCSCRCCCCYCCCCCCCCHCQTSSLLTTPFPFPFLPFPFLPFPLPATLALLGFAPRERARAKRRRGVDPWWTCKTWAVQNFMIAMAQWHTMAGANEPLVWNLENVKKIHFCVPSMHKTWTICAGTCTCTHASGKCTLRT